MIWSTISYIINRNTHTHTPITETIKQRIEGIMRKYTTKQKKSCRFLHDR